jgi:hypothetical protein
MGTDHIRRGVFDDGADLAGEAAVHNPAIGAFRQRVLYL